MSSQSSHHIQQYATLINHNKVKHLIVALEEADTHAGLHTGSNGRSTV